MRSYSNLIAAVLISACAQYVATSAQAACGEPSGCPQPPPPEPPAPEPPPPEPPAPEPPPPEPPAPEPPPPEPKRQENDQKPLADGGFALREAATAPSGSSQFVFVGSPAEIEKAGGALSDLGTVILRQKALGSLGTAMLVVDPNGQNVDAMRSALARQNARVTMDRNSIYETAGTVDNYAAQLVGLTRNTSESTCPLSRRVAIGLIDGPIDPQSPPVKGVNLRARSFLTDTDLPGDSTHATDLAILIAGRPDRTRTNGLAVGASLISAVAFAHGPGGDIARMDSVAEALDWLTGQNADIINMSLAGPQNDSLAYVLKLVARAGPVLIAATGNDSAPTVSYPASDPNVIAITAVDIAGRRYRQANSGAEVDFAAPGVDLLIDDGTGPRHLSGTSYATAVGTAVAAHLLAGGAKNSAEVNAQLKASAEDLGPVGHDDSFGWGLMRTSGLCQ